jgi:hypothetical protein
MAYELANKENRIAMNIRSCVDRFPFPFSIRFKADLQVKDRLIFHFSLAFEGEENEDARWISAHFALV